MRPFFTIIIVQVLAISCAHTQDISNWEANIKYNNGKEKISVDYLGLYEYYYLCGKPLEAIKIADQASQWVKSNKPTLLREVEALQWIEAHAIQLQDNPLKSKSKMYDLAAHAQDDSIKVLAMLSYVFMNSFDQPEPEMDSIYRLLKDNKILKRNSYLSIRHLLLQGLMYDANKDNKKAAEIYLQVASEADQIKYPLAKAQAYTNLGSLYLGKKDTLEIYYHRKALDIYKTIPQKSQYSNVLNNIGSYFNTQNQNDSALKYLNECVDYYKSSRKIFPLMQVYYNLGNVYTKLGDIKNAESHYLASFHLSDSFGVPQGLMYNNKGLGDVEMLKDNKLKASQRYKTSIELAEQLSEYDILRLASDSLASVSYANRDIESLWYWTEKRKLYIDSLYRRNEFAEIEAVRSEFQQKELLLENDLLRLKNSEAAKDIRINTIFIYVSIGFIAVLSIFLFILRINLSKKRELYDLLLKEKKKTEEQNQDLEQLNKEVTIKKQDLEMKQKELMISNNLKDSILSIISHDLRSPLANLSQLIHLMQLGHLQKQEFDEVIRSLDKEVKQNLMLVDNLLLWSKSHIAGERPQSGKIQVKDITREILALYESQIKEKQIFSNVELPEQVELLVSPEVLSLVLRNVISNAIKFSYPRGTLSIKAFERKKMYCISVSDQGVGMTSEQINHLFMASTKSTRGTAKEKGYGIGLKFVYEIITKLGGEIEVESESEKGSTFTICFPQ